ncbi:bifunctional nitrogenase iron-molybdenum cofactor biosynthesis protein NifEN [Anaeromyxobacter sp. PSR-1]|uniref:bifunctional nitrogenase iron-molybdenum cofactor biosynthesis protein NifEN n=1 Tax=unclassified Anaeromyxobacter TaxID=2620896 RepID=UPI0005DD06CB|nr:bifunctional nitrogenase iron-molybdenum cofactor biosynthesis protein NifEN [Anaeromyxobacter sp. PSR-1]GAO02068.1 nitrogenase iron-molybdenum cofactor biosynthesis protein NifE [Anaeromyxobacter sp. PSR-1]
MARPSYLDPTDCETLEKGAPRFCKKSEPGEGTERSCAYDGARVVLMPITDAIHLVHGPIACAGNSWDNRGARSSGSQLYRRGFTTELVQNDVVFGGEEKLHRAIVELAARYRGEAKAVFVYSTCVSALTGDDVEAACRRAAAEVDIPVIPVNAPGFVGDKNIGNRMAGEVLLDHVIGTAEPAVRTRYDVNLIGEYNIAGDLWGMLPLFERLGIRILSCISGDARFEDLRHAHRARLNVIVCSKSLTNLAKKLRKRWGIPYLEASFYGMTDTARALREMARALDLADGDAADTTLRDRVERLLGEEEAACRARIAPHRARLEGKRAVLFTGGVKTWSMVNALRELGVEVLAAGTQNSTLEDFHRMKALMHRDAHIIEDTSTAGLLQVMGEKAPDLVVAGGKTKFLALKTRTPFLDINHGRAHPYAGYAGMVTFARQLDLTVNDPIWKALDAPVAWATEAGAAAAARTARGHAGRLEAEDLSASRVKVPAKAATVNPQKNSPALGATLAYLGVDRMLGLLHGAQGCSTFIRLQLSRHFKESIALNSTAMSEDSAIFGGWENLKQGLARVAAKFRPGIIGVMTSGLTETMGDDVRSAIVQFRAEHPELEGLPVVWASTPDYCGSMQEGYAAAVEALLDTLAGGGERLPSQVTLLAGAHLTPAEVEELKQLVEAFGLDCLAVPDVSCALDGHVDDQVSPLSTGGVPVEAIRRAGRSAATIYVGDSLARAARRLEERFGVPAHGFTSATGLLETDALVATLSAISGRPVPEALRRARSRLLDAMVDSHYALAGKRVALALEADHLKGLVPFLAGMGCEVQVALAATRTRGLDRLPAARVAVGDLEDLEDAARGADLVVASSNGRQAVQKLGVRAHLRTGYPVFDRLGAHQEVRVGYRGTMSLIFEVANLLQAGAGEARKLAHN